ncbi:19435_t:CDS:2, partial [Gigaspora rosea]
IQNATKEKSESVCDNKVPTIKENPNNVLLMTKKVLKWATPTSKEALNNETRHQQRKKPQMLQAQNNAPAKKKASNWRHQRRKK